MRLCFTRPTASRGLKPDPSFLALTSTKTTVSPFAAIISISVRLAKKFFSSIRYFFFSIAEATASSYTRPSLLLFLAIFFCFPYRPVCHPVYGAGAVFFQRLKVPRRTVSFMSGKPVVRVNFVVPLHKPVPVYFRENGRCG